MPVKIRLTRKGRKQAPFYHIIIADARAPRDGKFIEKIGTYNPMTKPATIEVDRMAAYDWLEKGAQPTDTVRAILRFKGVYYRRHLMRGLKKGVLTQEQVDTAWNAWIDTKEKRIETRKLQTKADLDLFRKQVSGEVKVVKPVQDQETKVSADAFKVTEVSAEVTEEIVESAVEETVVDTAEEVTEEAQATSEDVVEDSGNESEEA